MHRYIPVCAFVMLMPICRVLASGVADFTLPATWHVKLDPQEAGAAQRWFAPGLDESGWHPVSTHRWAGWETQGLPEHAGMAWYRVRATIPASLKRKFAWLYFSAVDEEAWVWVDGHVAGEHTAASEGVEALDLWQKPFILDVTDLLRFEQPLHIAVRVRNQLKMGGIWQPVHLFFTDEQLTLEDAKVRAEALNQAILDAGRDETRYETWTSYAYAPVYPTSVHAASSGERGPAPGSWARHLSGDLRVSGACGEIVAFALNLRNRSAGPLRIRLDLQQVAHEQRSRFLLNASRVDVHVVDHVMTRAKDLVPDPLPRADGVASLAVPPEETRSFFVAIDTRGLPAGRWRGHLRLTPLRAGPALRIPFELFVAPVALPERSPLRVALWSYDPLWFCAAHGRGGDEPYHALMRRTGVNTVITRLYGLIRPVLEGGELVDINPIDFDAMLARHRFSDDDFLVFGVLPQSMAGHWGGDFLGERWSRNFIAYLKLAARHIRENHRISDDRWAVYLEDEHIGDHFVALGRLTREADPAIRIWANRIEDLAITTKAEPYIDIFVPVRWNLSLSGAIAAGRFPDSERLMHDKGKTWWMYAHSGWQPPNNRAVPRDQPHAPHRKLRMDGWMAWRLGLEGISYWVYVGKWWGRYSGFDDGERANTAFIYLGPDGPITSRRLEAYREGIEDYKLLWVLDRAAGLEGQDPAVVKAVRAHMASALSETLQTPLDRRTGERLLHWREVLLDDASKLCQSASLEVGLSRVLTTQRSATLELTASKPVRVWAWVRPGGLRPGDDDRIWTFVDPGPAQKPGRSPTITVDGLVPGQACALLLVIAGPEGQQRHLSSSFRTQGWSKQ